MHRENKNANAMCQNLWDAVEAVQRVKFIEINVHLNKQEKITNKNSTSQLKEWEKAEQMKPQNKYNKWNKDKSGSKCNRDKKKKRAMKSNLVFWKDENNL